MWLALTEHWCSMRSKTTWQSFGIFLLFMHGLIQMLATAKVKIYINPFPFGFINEKYTTFSIIQFRLVYYLYWGFFLRSEQNDIGKTFL